MLRTESPATPGDLQAVRRVLAVDQFSGVVGRIIWSASSDPTVPARPHPQPALGVYAIDSGEVIFQGKASAVYSRFEIGRLGIARTFQNIRSSRT